MVAVILFFGLNPATWPNSNNIQYSPESGGLTFTNPAFAYVENFTSGRERKIEDSFSIVLRFSPHSVQNKGFKPIFMVSDGNDSTQFSISQWEKSLIVMNGDDYSYSRREPRLFVEDILTQDTPLCITITTGPQGTHFFSNGLSAQRNEHLHLKIPMYGKNIRLTLGNTIYGNHSWEGTLYELAIYDSQLVEKDIQERCQHKTDEKHSPTLHYSFNNRSTNFLADLSGNNQPLIIPSRPLALKTSFLTFPTNGFTPDRGFFFDIIINFFGFMPFGAILLARLRIAQFSLKKRPVITTGAICFLLSLCIEMIQGWLPYRTSSLLDLILNTTGGLFAAVLFSIILTQKTKANLP